MVVTKTYWRICGLVGRATTFVGSDVGWIPTCCAFEVWQWTFGSRTVWLVNRSAGQPQCLNTTADYWFQSQCTHTSFYWNLNRVSASDASAAIWSFAHNPAHITMHIPAYIAYHCLYCCRQASFISPLRVMEEQQRQVLCVGDGRIWTYAIWLGVRMWPEPDFTSANYA